MPPADPRPLDMCAGVSDLDTPALIGDLDAVERNIARMQAHCDRHGLRLRPHVKTHKLPLVAHLQMKAGAVGLACQKLDEAEVMARSGLTQILITFPLVGERKWRRAARLAGEISLSVVGDSLAVAQGLSAALPAGVEVGFFVECDVGRWRTGVHTPEGVVALARAVHELPGLRLRGLMTHPTPPESEEWLSAAIEGFARAGLPVPEVTVGGTPTAFQAHELAPIASELRAGTYVYGDRACLQRGHHTLDECALRVRATVVSRPTPTRAIIDAGSKTLSSDAAEGYEDDGLFGLVVEQPLARITGLSEEHGHIDLSACPDGLELGQVVTIVPNHACAVTNLHDQVVLHRGGRIVTVAPILARGAIR